MFIGAHIDPLSCYYRKASSLTVARASSCVTHSDWAKDISVAHSALLFPAISQRAPHFPPTFQKKLALFPANSNALLSQVLSPLSGWSDAGRSQFQKKIEAAGVGYQALLQKFSGFAVDDDAVVPVRALP